MGSAIEQKVRKVIVSEPCRVDVKVQGEEVSLVSTALGPDGDQKGEWVIYLNAQEALQLYNELGAAISRMTVGA